MIEFDAITTLCLACVLYLIGQTIINHVSILRRICIPAPVIGGLLFAILVAILDSFNIVKIKLDSAFRISLCSLSLLQLDLAHH